MRELWQKPVISATLCALLFSCGSQELINFGKGRDINAAEPQQRMGGLRAEANAYPEAKEFNFTTMATAKVYERHPDGELETVSFPVDASGFLSNDFFTTEPQSDDRAFSNELRFDYDVEDPRFEEVSLFANLNKLRNWYRGLGIEPVSVQIPVRVGGDIMGNINNAMYTPASEKSGPSLTIAKGDGYVLQNLTLDADVISHELAHHVIYHSIQATSGDALILHEGLADFFTMLRNKDACLGRSICPASSPICEIRAQCLRSAENQFSFAEDMARYDVILGTQVLSGFLWDFYQVLGSGSEKKLGLLLIRALEKVENAPSIEDFVTALILADEEQNEGKNAKVISQLAKKRGVQLN
jgi:hypothetical protein